MHRQRALVVVSVVLATGVLLSSRPSRACSVPADPNPSPYVTDSSQSSDAVTPGIVVIEHLYLRRGLGPTNGADCRDVGGLTLLVSAADDRTPVGDLGYLVTRVDGELPTTLPNGPLQASNGQVSFVWFEADPQPIGFTGSVSAVDRAGNVGPATWFVVEDEGDGLFGCEVAAGGAPAGPSGWLAALALGLAFLLLRRTQRSTPRWRRGRPAARAAARVLVTPPA